MWVGPTQARGGFRRHIRLQRHSEVSSPKGLPRPSYQRQSTRCHRRWDYRSLTTPKQSYPDCSESQGRGEATRGTGRGAQPGLINSWPLALRSSADLQNPGTQNPWATLCEKAPPSTYSLGWEREGEHRDQTSSNAITWFSWRAGS